MPFLGTTPTQGFVGANPKQSFTANGSTTVFTLTNPVASANDLEVFVGNVRQEPTTAYTAAGTTLTMSEAPATGLNFYVINKSFAQVTTTPPVNSISTDKIVNDAVTSAKLDTNIAVAGTLGVTGATTLSSTLASGAITSTGAVQGTQFNVGGLKVLETSTFDYGNSTNKSVNTAYDFTYTLAAGTWIPFLKFYAAFFENHGNSNSTGIYYPFTYLGSQAGGEEYGSHYTVVPKWGNASNSYSTMSHSAIAPFTLSSSSTIYIRWYVIEYGTSSNFWCRNSGNKIIFLRIG